MRKRNLLILSCFLLTTLASCDGTEGGLPDLPVFADPDSPSYDGGLEGNEANDDFTNENDKNIEVLLENASKYEKYTYEVNVKKVVVMPILVMLKLKINIIYLSII